MRSISTIAVMGLALAAVPAWAQAGAPGSQSSVVGATGPVYQPDPQPRAAPQPSQQTAGDSGQGQGRGSHSGHRHHRDGGSGGYAGMEGGPS